MARELTRAAKTAKVIRQDLKKVFPEVKFSVTSSNFSMGDSVNISWTDGPVGALVNVVVEKYQRYAGTNPYNDCPEYNAIDADSLGCDGVEYISCSREVSTNRINEVFDSMDNGAQEAYMSSYYNSKRDAAIMYEVRNPETWPEAYRIMWEKIKADRKAEAEKEAAERQEALESEETTDDVMEQPSNIISFADFKKRKEKKRQADEDEKMLAEGIKKFKAEVLPTMTKSDIDRLQEAISSGDEEQYKNIMAQVLFKASMINHKEG